MVHVKKRKIEQKVTVYQGKGKHTTIKQSLAVCNSIDNVKNEPLPSTRHEFIHHPDEPTKDPPKTVVQAPETTENKYTLMKRKRLQGWKNIRNDLLDAFITSEVPNPMVCTECRENLPVFRCLDCSPWLTYCENCLQVKHQSPHLHIFEGWRETAFVGFDCDTPHWTIPHTCETLYKKKMIIVDDKGRQHMRMVQFCRCEPEPVTLVRYKLWPASDRFPKIAFDFELLKWLNGLLLEGHLSVRSFCDSLSARSSKHHRSYTKLHVQNLYKILKSEALEEFRHFYHLSEHLTSEHANLDDGTDCPACYSVDNPQIYSFDADFQLVRKASSGRNWVDPNHTNSFFLRQEGVDAFMDSYQADKKKLDAECSDFQAGSALRSKNKNSKLAETAVFGSTCRHEYPKYFFSLKHGERLGYAVYLLKRLIEEKQSDQQPLYIMYDIACSLESHLKKHSDENLDKKVTFSIPIFHSYGHKLSCQVKYGPRRIKGIGLTDGESMERLWSYLGKFSKITKEMTPENRTDLLVDGLLHYGRKIRDKFGTSLTAKIDRAINLEKTSLGALADLLQPIEGISDETVLSWIDDEKMTFLSSNTETVTFTPAESYSLALDEYDNYRRSLDTAQLQESSVLKRLDNQVKKLRKRLPLDWNRENHDQDLSAAKEKKRKEILLKLQNHAAERMFLLELMKKYAKGQAIAIRLTKQLKTLGTKLQKLINEYNSVGGAKVHFPMSLTFEDVKLQDSSVWLSLNPSTNNITPYSIRRQAVHLRLLIDRAVEEQGLVRAEMNSVFSWHLFQYEKLIDCVSKSEGGAKALIVKEGLSIEAYLFQLYSRFKTYVGELCVPTVFRDLVGVPVIDREQTYSLSDLDLEWLDDGQSTDDESTEDEEEAASSVADDSSDIECD